MPAAVATRQTPAHLLLRNGVALRGEQLEARPFRTLRIADGVVVAVDEPGDAEAAGQVVDLDGGFVLPGLIDCHVHFDLAAHPAAYMHYAQPPLVRSFTVLHNGLTALLHGITTVRDLGSADHLVLHYAARVEAGLLVGPRVLAAGRPITATGGHFSQYARVADGTADVRLAVREQIAAGARVIKLMATGGISTPGDPGASQLTVEEMAVAVEEAHRRGLHVAAHAHAGDGIRAALAAGVDTIEHAAFADADVLQAVLDHSVTLVPTVVALSPIEAGLGIPEATVRKSLAARDRYQESTRRAIDAGVTIAAGTDAGTALNPIGGLVDELQLYVRLGMTPLAAIRAATVTAGAVIGGGLGVLETGRPADLIVVADDPTDDVAVLRRPRHVVSGGRLVDLGWAERTAGELRGVIAEPAG